MTKEQERWVVGIMLSVTLVKLLLMVYCRSFTNEIVKAYAQDHFFDVVTNIIGLIAALLANYMEEWMDPVGAIIVSTNHLPPSLSLLAIIFLLTVHELIEQKIICFSLAIGVVLFYLFEITIRWLLVGLSL